MYNIFNRFALHMWPICWTANRHSYTFTGFISGKEKVGQLTDQLVCVAYDCLRSDPSTCVLSLRPRKVKITM